MKLELSDLKPIDAKLVLSEKPGLVFTLGKITLRVRIWLKDRFEKDALAHIFSDQSLAELSEIAYYLLKEKTEFPTLESFQDAIVTQEDIQNLMKAVFETVGISEPLIDKIAAETLKEAQAQGNAESLSPPTGALPTT
jgi:hypothetical protein